MKNLRILYLLSFLVFIFSSCEDEAPKATLKSSVAPNELKAPSAGSYVLTIDNSAEVMETFQWTAPDYGFPAGAIYTLQVDVAGNNFANAVEVLNTSALEAEVTVGAFNDILLGLGLTPEEAGEVELRVISDINPDVPVVTSNARAIEVTAYATSFPPIWGMGAGLKGWGPWPDNAVEWQSSEFKKYETVAYFTQGETFRWFAQLDWGPTSYNYPYFTTVDPTFENANDGDSNLRIVGETGWYRVGVDLGAKVVTAVAVDEPVLYMMGAALNGWGPWPGAAVKMTYIKPGVFEADANFTVQNETFRFFAQPDWSPTSYNYPYFETVDANFENANDGDSNLRFIGTPGSLKITVDLNAMTVTVGDEPDPELFITGDDFGWGWNEGQFVQMTYKGADTFEATVDLTANSLFRFFPQKDWSPSYIYSYFTTVDDELENQGAGTDENFRYVGADGSRKITVNLVTKVVTVE